MKNTIVIASALYNWGETHRMVGFGNELIKRGYKIVFLGEGKYDYLLEGTGFERIIPKSDAWWFTPERIFKMMNMDIYGNDYTTFNELEEIINEEAYILNNINPVAVVTGYRTTLSISAKIAKVKLVWCLSAVVSPMYFELGLASGKESADVAKFLREFESEDIKRQYLEKWTKKIALTSAKTSTIWNECLKKHGFPILKRDIDLFKGNLNLMSDAQELFPRFIADKSFKFCGPIFTYEKFPMPECAKKHVSKDKKIIFIAMGSSGEKEIIYKTLNSIKRLPYEIFVATAGILADEETKGFGENFHFEKRVPLVDMFQFADLAIIHGGQGTVYSAIVGRCPIIGIPMFNEQQYNLENLNRNKCGIILNKKDIGELTIAKAVIEILTNKTYENNIKKVSENISKYYYDKRYSANTISADIIGELIENEGNVYIS